MRLVRLLAVYELLAAASAVALMLSVLRWPGLDGALILACASFAVLSGLAGVLLWRDRPAGYRVAAVNEALRVVRFATPWVSYYAFAGLDLNIGWQYFPHGLAGMGSGAVAAGFWLAANAVATLQFSIMREPPFYGAGVNAIGILVLVELYVAYHRHRRETAGPAPVPSDAGPGP